MKKKTAQSLAMEMARQISREPKTDRRCLAAAMTKASDRAIAASDSIAKTRRRIIIALVVWKILKRVL